MPQPPVVVGPDLTPPRLPDPTPPRLPGPGAFDPGRRGVRALALVAVLVVLAAAVLAWRARPRIEPIAPGVSPPPVADAAVPSVASTAVVVAVAGRVRRPGLVRLPSGARVADAIAEAGGVLPGTDVAFLNLARKVSDGELIVVGVTPPPGVGVDAGVAGAAPGVSGGKVNLNTATVAQLDTLPGVGPVLAQRIVDHRDRHGSFRSVGELRQVDGIGDAKYEQLKQLVTV
jgi:competence protein ComEA